MTDVQDKIYHEVYRQTERRLDAQLSAEASRDQRALVVVAFSIASAGFTIRAAESSQVDAFIGAGVAFVIAAIFAALAALPREFHGVGYRYTTLSGVIEKSDGYASLLVSLAAKNDEYIDKNAQASLVTINLYRFAIFLFSLGSLLGLIGIILLDGNFTGGDK